MQNQKVRKAAIVIFYDNLKNIVVQERGSYSKSGEKYGFWGGGIEKDELPKRALIRELNEELGYVPDKIEFWDKESFVIKNAGKYKGWRIELYVFLSPITQRLLSSKVKEGSGVVKMGIDEAISSNGLWNGDIELLDQLKKKLNW